VIRGHVDVEGDAPLRIGDFAIGRRRKYRRSIYDNVEAAKRGDRLAQGLSN